VATRIVAPDAHSALPVHPLGQHQLLDALPEDYLASDPQTHDELIQIIRVRLSEFPPSVIQPC